MSEDKSIKLIKAVKELNIGMNTIVDFLASKGYKIDKQPMAKQESRLQGDTSPDEAQVNYFRSNRAASHNNS